MHYTWVMMPKSKHDGCVGDLSFLYSCMKSPLVLLLLIEIFKVSDQFIVILYMWNAHCLVGARDAGWHSVLLERSM